MVPLYDMFLQRLGNIYSIFEADQLGAPTECDPCEERVRFCLLLEMLIRELSSLKDTEINGEHSIRWRSAEL